MSSVTSPTPPPQGPPKLTNLYNLRPVATPKPCFICSKETSWCLANSEMSDWMFVCFNHVLDPAFAKPASSSSTSTTPTNSNPSTPKVSQSEIEKVKAEYFEKQRKKEQASTTSTKESTPPACSSTTPSTTTTGKAFSVLKSSVSTISSLASTATSTSSSILFPPPEPVIPSPTELLREEAKTSKVFILNKTYFEMRCSKKRKEWEKKDAKERGKEWSFPKVPKGGLP
ncbi:hypothetical protein JCM3765_006461 [Sporobolomyces pararoseus]